MYKIRSSPFLGDAFLSCSADWSIKLWSQSPPKDNEQMRFSFNSVEFQDVTHDVAWSPLCSTVFGSVTGDGRVEVFDLAASTLDPVVTVMPPPTAGEVAEAEAEAAAAAAAAADPDDLALDADAEVAPPAPPKRRQFTCITFGRTDPVVVVGDANGAVDVFRLQGVGRGASDIPVSDAEQAEALRLIMFPEGQ